MARIDKSKAIVACNYDTMTSLEVAELTGMRHDHLLRDIRKMEIGWIEAQINPILVASAQVSDNQCKPNFGFTSRDIIQPNGGTRKEVYAVLDRLQWLYVATKFNDVARAKLVLRWEQLEKEQRQAYIDREVGKIVRRSFTDVLKDSGENERMHGFAYSTYTNKIYKSLFGMNAKQIREYLKIDAKANIREHISEIAIKRISALEKIAQHLVEMGCQYQMICEEIDNIVQKQNFGIALTQLKAK